MLARIKLDHPGIRKAILELDDEKLTIDELRAIGKQLPTSEEASVTRLKDFENVGRLAKADQYFAQIMTIPRLSERLDCMLYRRKLEIEIEEIRPELNIVRNASLRKTVLALGNALNGSTFRGGARGFQLNGLLKLKETKTAKGGDCPTLLHYLARVLLRSDPSAVTFIEDMPHVEAAARVSVQTVIASVQALSSGLLNLQTEIRQLRSVATPSNDRFISVMQPFVAQVGEGVNALNHMANALDSELQSLLAYFGEIPDSPEAPKPEDFFGLILTFSSSLQKAALDVHDSVPKAPQFVIEDPTTPTAEPTIKLGDNAQMSLMPPPTSQSRASSQGRAAGLSLGRGDLDQAIRSMRDGKRRARPHRPVSKIFLDGTRASRLYE
ncbi:hypothetical protein EW026_g3828 [Hermanssonia centrifuga]|uniref:FH2 domain-containing protein n=1 Tax=Hermanssonia centrifuga TaxID=98765 RepID=A0A4S4KIZ8_9APHY|nr:hypothetical protein EW026_g3828 [Hermanssonia centrifuga]